MLKKKMLMFLFRNKKTQKWRYNPSGYISASSRTMLETANWDIFIKKSSKDEREWTLECSKVDLQLQFLDGHLISSSRIQNQVEGNDMFDQKSPYGRIFVILGT